MNQWLEIGRTMLVSPEPSESDVSFTQRVLLSAGSAWMQTTLFVNGGQVSVERLKSTVDEKMTLLRKTSACLIDVNTKACTDYIYETLLNNGMFLHTPRYGHPAPRKLIGNSPSILRGMHPEEPCTLSGLAPLLLTTPGNETVQEAFDLPAYQQDRAITLLWKRGIPVNNFLPDEVLNAQSGGRWRRYEQETVSKTGLSMGRTMHGINQYDYYLIQGNQVRRISEDMRKAQLHDYLRIALLHREGQRIKVQARCGKHLVFLSLGYLPRPELRFLRLVCWPESLNDLKQVYRFSVHTSLWPMLRERFQSLDYNVEEICL